MSQIIIINHQGKECDDPTEWYKFREWVENTQLFHTLVMATNRRAEGVEYEHIRTPDMLLTIESHIKVHTFDDLPKEMVYQFYINSPWYNNNQTIKNLLE